MKYLVFIIITFIYSNIYSQPVPVAHWTFNNPDDLTEAMIGSKLNLIGTHLAVDGPTDSTGAIKIGVGSYYICNHGISPNGGGSLVNNYTIVLDVKIPVYGFWYTFYQTETANSADGDWFVNPSGNIGVGETGYTGKTLRQAEWHRVAISVKNGVRHDYYIDGKKALTGTPGAVDGRFALDKQVLFFADENSEDNSFEIAEIRIYSTDLTDSEISELGGYEHDQLQVYIESYPYLQSPTANSIYVCWSFIGENPEVEYGLSENLGSKMSAETIILEDDFTINWFTAKIDNLEPGKTYFYKVKTDSIESEIYKFRTQPADNDSTEHIRFVVYSDNQTNFAKFEEINDSVKSKVNALYGKDIEEEINLVFESGDIVDVGSNLGVYFPQYFNPSHTISTSVPYMNSIGNHEEDSPHYFDFMKYEDFGGPQGEKYYSFRIGRVLFIAINSNSGYRNDTQIKWLDQILQEAQVDDTIEWIFAANHHPGRSELWPDGNTSYVQNRFIPTLAKYSKVDMLHYGHSHNNERGTAIDGNLRLLCIGGAGGALDRWDMYNNQENYPEIQKSFDHYCYAIVDIDIAKKSCEVTTYSLGNPDNPLDNVVIDKFIRNKASETPPKTPSFITPVEDEKVAIPFVLQASDYEGTYEIMSSQFQVTNNKGVYDSPILDVKRDFEDIFGTPQAPNYFSIDLNAGIDLTKLAVSELEFNSEIWGKSEI